MRTKRIKIPIYKGNLTIIEAKDLNEVSKKYKTPDLSNYGAVTLKDNNKYREYVVAFETDSFSNSLIAHEVVHIVNYIYLDCGIELDRVNDEPQAYLTQFLFKEIEKFFQKN